MAEEKGARVPKFCVIEQALMERIRAGAFSFDEPLCTEAALMQEFGSSRITVRRALEELENKGFITRKRGIGCFVSRTAYESLRTGEAEGPAVSTHPSVYAFVYPESRKKSDRQAFFDGASEAADAQDAHAVLYLAGSRPEERVAALLTRFAGMDLAGVAVCAEDAAALLPEIHRLLLQGKAVVTYGGKSTLPHVSGVCMDTASAMHTLVGHLVSLGHTRIACFCADERAAAEYMLALADHALPVQPELICRAGDAGALRRCVTAGATAVLAQRADIAQQLALEMTMLGQHIPGSMSLCCMEDCAPLPALRRGEALRSVTCMQFDEKVLGKTLAVRLMELQGAPIQAAQHTLLTGKLSFGTTTAKCRGGS